MATGILDLSVTFRMLFYNLNEERLKTPREVVKFFQSTFTFTTKIFIDTVPVKPHFEINKDFGFHENITVENSV